MREEANWGDPAGTGAGRATGVGGWGGREDPASRRKMGFHTLGARPGAAMEPGQSGV